jgi:hypothetical protein
VFASDENWKLLLNLKADRDWVEKNRQKATPIAERAIRSVMDWEKFMKEYTEKKEMIERCDGYKPVV